MLAYLVRSVLMFLGIEQPRRVIVTRHKTEKTVNVHGSSTHIVNVRDSQTGHGCIWVSEFNPSLVILCDKGFTDYSNVRWYPFTGWTDEQLERAGFKDLVITFGNDQYACMANPD